MKVVNLDRRDLGPYIRRQLANLLPMPDNSDCSLIDLHLEAALNRLDRCISAIRVWTPGQFDVLHSSQYCAFLYYLANTIWNLERHETICTKLFLLNKFLNGIDCFYTIELPEVFYIGHSTGVVLASGVKYGNYLVLYQNSTVGKNHGVAPEIGERVVLYPNSAVIGRSRIGDGSLISQGVGVVNQHTPGDSAVFRGPSGNLVFKPLHRDVMADFFRAV